MQNIVDVTIELLKNSQNGVSTKEIAKKVKNPQLKELKPEELEAHIITDLLLDGRFIFVSKKWNLKDNFTMKEIVSEQYRSLGEFDVADDDNSEIEIKMAVDIDQNDQLEQDDVVSIDNVDEYHEQN